MTSKNLKHTLYASYIGYIVQGIVNNFAPLCFIVFQHEFGLSLAELTFIITINFFVQLCLDYLSTKFIDKIGYKTCIVIAHLLCACGLLLLTILPGMISSYLAILLSVSLYAIGGGLIEVLVSPIVEACPLDNKEAQMSLLHSFYCFGHVGTIVLTALFFFIFGTSKWRILTIIFALIPLFNAFYYLNVPIYQLSNEKDTNSGFNYRLLFVFLVLMLTSGCAEMAMSQWASYFCENNLHMSKSLGDLIGPGGFALAMGISRFTHSRQSQKMSLEKYILLSAMLCLVAYVLIVVPNNSYLGLLGFIIGGFSVGVLWPGTYSLAAKYINVNTASFAYIALAGDIGCTLGPSMVGFISNIFNNELKIGLACAMIFPLIIIFTVISLMKRKQHL